MLQKAGFDVRAVAFQRRSHPGRMPTCPVLIIGTLERARYAHRFACLLRAIPAVRRAISSHDLIYVAGVDMAALCLLAGVGLGRPMVLEIGDIRELQTAMNWKGSIVRRLDKLIADSCRLLVATAPEFIETYYRKWVGTKTRAVVIENKLDTEAWPQQIAVAAVSTAAATLRVESAIRIGYFGVLRWADSWETLMALAKALPKRVEIMIAGEIAVSTDLSEQIKECPNISYLGEYHSPHDLPRLYGNIDIVWAVYPKIGPEDWNLKWARTNRFYEACFFRRPIVARSGSKDAEEIVRLGIGMTIDSNDRRSIIEQFDELKPEQVREWQANCRALPSALYLLSSEAEELESELRGVLSDVN